MNEADDITLRQAQRAADALTRPGAFVEPMGAGYAVRLRPDRRLKPVMRFGEATFHVLAKGPGLRPRADGGWSLVRREIQASPPPPGCPSHIEGERLVAEHEGMAKRRANLGESPLAWLARRKDADGIPWLTGRELAAGEKLRTDFYRAGLIGRLTMDWSAQPRGSDRRGQTDAPIERGMAARKRIREALLDVGPELSPILEKICFLGSALDAAERDLGLPRRTGKVVLKLALQRLATHYRMG